MPLIKPTNQWSKPIDLTPLRKALMALGVPRKHLTKPKLAKAAAALLDPLLEDMTTAFTAFNVYARKTYAIIKAFRSPESDEIRLWFAPRNPYIWKRARKRDPNFSRLPPQPGRTSSI